MSLRLFVFDDGETGPMFMANPELSEPIGELLEDEGCLSIPGPYHQTPRFARIQCRGQDLEGTPYELTGEGLLARIFQHETDHLDGMLYIDRLDDEGRRDVMAQLRRIEMGLAEPGRTSQE
jgi:peptide deformylase